MYAAPVWRDRFRFTKNRACLSAVQRSVALRIISAYKTVSDEAALVLAGYIHADLLAAERKRTLGAGRGAAGNEIRKRESSKTIEEWHERWSKGTKGS